MNFGRRDMAVLISMSLALLIMTTAFNAVGVNEGANETEMPSLSIPEDRFNVAEDFPESPGFPSKGTLIWNTEDSLRDNYQIYLNETDTSRVRLGTLNLGNATHPDFEARLTLMAYDSDAGTQIQQDVDRVNFTGVGDYGELELVGYDIYVEWESIENHTDSPERFMVDFEIRDQVQSESFGSRIPVVGGLFGAGEALASTLGWIGSIIAWFVMTLFEIVMVMVTTIYDVLAFAVGFIGWQAGNYASIVGSAPVWASAFMAIPGVLLALELMKIAMLAIQLLPTT